MTVFYFRDGEGEIRYMRAYAIEHAHAYVERYVWSQTGSLTAAAQARSTVTTKPRKT